MGKPSKRRAQKAVERRKAKRKAGLSIRQHSGFPPIPPAAPIYECLVFRNLFDLGIGQVVIARELSMGQIAVVIFLLDVYCLGAKDVMFGVFSVLEYREKTRFTADGSFEPIAAQAARNLVEGAVEYAQRCGLSPHPDYRVANRIFAGIDSASPDRPFSYGKDGKPFYVSGPRDTPAKSRRIVAALDRACGPGGFDYLIMLGTENARTGQEIEPIDPLD
jgi:hypothetical protein